MRTLEHSHLSCATKVRARRQTRNFLARAHRLNWWPTKIYAGFAPPSTAVANVPPSPMVSTAEDGTITIEPRSLMAS